MSFLLQPNETEHSESNEDEAYHFSQGYTNLCWFEFISQIDRAKERFIQWFIGLIGKSKILRELFKKSDPI